MKGNQRMRYSLFSFVLCGLLLVCDVALSTSAFPRERAGETPAKLATEASRRGEELRRKWNLDSATGTRCLLVCCWRPIRILRQPRKLSAQSRWTLTTSKRSFRSHACDRASDGVTSPGRWRDA